MRDVRLPAPLVSIRIKITGQRVGGMSEKKHEALDEGDFHQNVAEAYGHEIKQR